MIAQSRKHLASFLEGHMRRVYSDGAGASRRSGDSVPIKTYLIEGRGPVAQDPDDDSGPVGALNGITRERALSEVYGPRVHTADSPDLATIEVRHDENTRLFIYADCRDPRFWLLHTFAPSRIADRFVSRFVAARRDVGRTSLPGELLQMVAAMGSTVAVSLDHERRNIGPGARRAGAYDLVKARIWGTHPGQLLSLIRKLGSFADGIALSTVQVRYVPEDRNDTIFCQDDIRYDGRMITRGTSFAAHMTLAEALRESYARQVDRIESRHAVRMEGDDGIHGGRSLALRLTRPIRDLERFSEMVFSSASPFLLWGLPVRRGRNCVAANAVDLNLGHRLHFELTPEFIRVFIPGESSGGTVVRFYTNLQHHLDPQVRLLDQDEHDVLQL